MLQGVDATDHSTSYLRRGWTVPGVESRYIRSECAADQYVGRTVAGLPLDSENFAVLPAHFKTMDDDNHGLR